MNNLHNHDELTESQISTRDGWRLLDASEIIDDGKPAPAIDGLEMWMLTRWSGFGRGNSHGSSYRTKLSREQLEQKRNQV